MIILGISESHTCTAALMIDGEIVAAVSEERFSRRKGEQGFPQDAIKYCLDYILPSFNLFSNLTKNNHNEDC